MPRGFLSLNRIEDADLAAQRVEQRRQTAARWERRVDGVEADRDAAKLTAHVLQEVKQPARLTLVGVEARSVWPGGNYDHVPLAVAQLRELGLDARALPVCAPLHPLLLQHTTATWRQQFRQCIVVPPQKQTNGESSAANAPQRDAGPA